MPSHPDCCGSHAGVWRRITCVMEKCYSLVFLFLLLFSFPAVCDCKKCWTKCLEYVRGTEMSPGTGKQRSHRGVQSLYCLVPRWAVLSWFGYFVLSRAGTHWAWYAVIQFIFSLVLFCFKLKSLVLEKRIRCVFCVRNRVKVLENFNSLWPLKGLL